MVSKGRFAYLPDLSFALIWMFWVGTLRGRNLDGGTLKRTKKIRIKTGGRKVKKKKGGGRDPQDEGIKRGYTIPSGRWDLPACLLEQPSSAGRASARERARRRARRDATREQHTTQRRSPAHCTFYSGADRAGESEHGNAREGRMLYVPDTAGGHMIHVSSFG